MKVFAGLDGYAPGGKRVCLAVGTFDGMHRGHRAVVAALAGVAAAEGGEAVAVTFDPHPVSVVAPTGRAHLLSTIDERIELFAASGVDSLLVLRFDETMREMRAETWLGLVEEHLHPSHLVISSSHTFGRDRRGGAEMLIEWGRRRGVGIVVVPPVSNGGTTISSTAIRERLRAGDVRTAAQWLGRWYGLRGVVVAGSGMGRRLGFPTANLSHHPEKVLPGHGVYAAYASVGGTDYPAAVNLGVRPTFGGGDRVVVEAHLIGAELDLYGREIEIRFVERLREEETFADPGDLAVQVSRDVMRAARLLEIEQRSEIA